MLDRALILFVSFGGFQNSHNVSSTEARVKRDYDQVVLRAIYFGETMYPSLEPSLNKENVDWLAVYFVVLFTVIFHNRVKNAHSFKRFNSRRGEALPVCNSESLFLSLLGSQHLRISVEIEACNKKMKIGSDCAGPILSGDMEVQLEGWHSGFISAVGHNVCRAQMSKRSPNAARMFFVVTMAFPLGTKIPPTEYTSVSR